MSVQSANNKRIAKNTLFLYLRMIIVMGIGLYTARAILDLLGVVNYGIYNVIGGFVYMFSFLSATLTTSSQRYFSIEIAKGDQKKLKQWFSLNVTIFSVFIVIVFVVLETVGLWFVNCKMTIPEDRLASANIVYQLSILTFCVQLFSTPYNALIVAHEKMSAFAYISIVEALFKLFMIYILTIISSDKLIVYGILMLISSCIVSFSYILYDYKYFRESRFYLYLNKRELKELFSFSGWHFIGTLTSVITTQGINVLLNLFFNPVVNAARAIANQIYTACSQLNSNFFVAVKPEIYKSYAMGEMNELHKLILRSMVACSFLTSILVFPVLTNTNYILGLWLKEVPDYTVIFTQLILVKGLIDSVNGTTYAPALATGKVRKFMLVNSSVLLLIFPISYIILAYGANPEVVFYVSIVIDLIATVVRAVLLKGMMPFPLKDYLFLFFKLVMVSLGLFLVIHLTIYNICSDFFTLIIHSGLIVIFLSVVYYYCVINRYDRKVLYDYAYNRIMGFKSQYRKD